MSSVPAEHVISVIDEAEALLSQADEMRARLILERQDLVARIEQIDAMMAKLPGAAALAPATMGEWMLRRTRLQAVEIGRAGQPINARDVIHAASAFYGLNVSDLRGSGRTKCVARARHVAIYIARRVTSESSTEIGAVFGRDHSTVLTTVQDMDEKLGSDAELRAEVVALETAIRSAQGKHEQAEAAE